MESAQRWAEEDTVGAPARTHMADVERGIAALRARGVQVAFQSGRVVGLAALRAEVGGGGDRVRAMAILAPQREHGRVDAEEVRQARERLGGDETGGARSPLAGVSRADRTRPAGRRTCSAASWRTSSRSSSASASWRRTAPAAPA